MVTSGRSGTGEAMLWTMYGCQTSMGRFAELMAIDRVGSERLAVRRVDGVPKDSKRSAGLESM